MLQKLGILLPYSDVKFNLKNFYHIDDKESYRSNQIYFFWNVQVGTASTDEQKEETKKVFDNSLQYLISFL